MASIVHVAHGAIPHELWEILQCFQPTRAASHVAEITDDVVLSPNWASEPVAQFDIRFAYIAFWLDETRKLFHLLVRSKMGAPVFEAFLCPLSWLECLDKPPEKAQLTMRQHFPKWAKRFGMTAEELRALILECLHMPEQSSNLESEQTVDS